MPGSGASPNPINEAAAHALADGVGASNFRIGFWPLGALILHCPGCGWGHSSLCGSLRGIRSGWPWPSKQGHSRVQGQQRGKKRASNDWTAWSSLEGPHFTYDFSIWRRRCGDPIHFALALVSIHRGKPQGIAFGWLQRFATWCGLAKRVVAKFQSVTSAACGLLCPRRIGTRIHNTHLPLWRWR